ncbi:MAG: hypothetical protein AAFU55_13095 [Pseudomonadota bacterium]
MPLPILGALVVFGIGGIVLLVHLLRMSKRLSFADEAAARAVLAHDHPDAEIRDVLLTDNRSAAIFSTSAGPAVTTAFGDGWFTRAFEPGDVKEVREEQARLHVRLDDFGAPSISLALADPARRAAAKAILEAVK